MTAVHPPLDPEDLKGDAPLGDVMTTTTITAAEASLKANGRTFHWARRFLGDSMGHPAAQLYQFCRLLDDLADGDLPDGAQRLKALHDHLKKGTPLNDTELTAFFPFIEDHDLPIDVILALIDGLIMDQDTVALQTEAEIIRYGYHVAGTVGLLMCRILNCNDPDAAPYAIDLGIAMQLTNIARDVLEDAQMGRRYLPADWVQSMTADDIVSAAKHKDESGHRDGIETIRGGVQHLLGLAEVYYNSGINGLYHLPLRAHIAILIAARSYRQIGVQLARLGSPWYDGRQVTSTLTKAGTSIAALPLMAKRLRTPPPHQAYLHQPLAGLPFAHRDTHKNTHKNADQNNGAS